MSIEQIIVLAVLVFIIITLYFNIFKAPISFLIGIVLLSIAGVLTPEEILKGFSNEQLAVIMLLLIIGDVLQRTRLLDIAFEKLFKNAKTYNGFLSRMMLYVSASSAFLNNTPLVAMVMPYAINWAKKYKISPSKLLIPLSYASILGGAATLIGTSTNLLVNGLVIETNSLIKETGFEVNGQIINKPLSELEIFDFSIVGIPMIFIGILYMLVFGKKLLPENKAVSDSLIESSREYIVETFVKNGSTLIGKSIEKAGLRNLEGLYLIEIIRDDEKIRSVAPEEKIREGDILLFVGATETLTNLMQSVPGLSLPEKVNMDMLNVKEMHEVVIPYNSVLSGKTVKDSNFRAKLDAAIIAIHRNGELLSGKIGDMIMQPGDLLMLFCGRDFSKRIEGNNDIYVISKKNIEVDNKLSIRSIILLTGVLAAVVMASIGLVSLFQSLIVLLALIVLTKVATLSEVKKGIRFNILLIAGMALALGKAMIKTGTADLIANLILNDLNSMGVLVIMFGLYLITNILAGYLTNVAALSIIYPIALGLAFSMNVEPKAFILLVAFASSANFFTPIGYQTNLMVFGPGRYSFTDYLKVGGGISIIYMFVCVILLAYTYGLI